MLKKIYISGLVLILLVSTTGLPATINLCKMANTEDAEQCTMHHKAVESKCCEKESSSYIITSSDYAGCCVVKFIYNKVEDEFILNKTEASFFSSDNISHQLLLLPPTLDFSNNEFYYCDSSPPFLINSQLHIINSILLI